MPRRFQTTRWSLVRAAQSAHGEESLRALAALCEAYWEPLYAHVRRRCRSREEAEDLTQEFFHRLLEKRYLDEVRRDAGRLRSFLLASLDHFLANEWHRVQALKRGGGHRLISLDSVAAEARFSLEPSHELTPELAFERRWALTVLTRARTRLEAEWSASGKRRLFVELQPHLTGQRPVRSHRDTADRLGTSEGAVKVALHRLRRRLGELLRDEVAQTVADEAGVEAELRYLLSTLEDQAGG